MDQHSLGWLASSGIKDIVHKGYPVDSIHQLFYPFLIHRKELSKASVSFSFQSLVLFTEKPGSSKNPSRSLKTHSSFMDDPKKAVQMKSDSKFLSRHSSEFNFISTNNLTWHSIFNSILKKKKLQKREFFQDVSNNTRQKFYCQLIWRKQYRNFLQSLHKNTLKRRN